MKDFVDQAVRELTLKLKTYHTMTMIPLPNMRVHAEYDIRMQQLISRLDAYIYSYEHKSISYPCTWLDAFKERWFPQWLLKLYPPAFYIHTPETLFVDLPHSVKQKYTTIRWAEITVGATRKC